MLPKVSTAGLATGCRFSATRTPISQAQDSLAWPPLSITSSPAVAPSGTRAMTNESEPMMTGRADFADGDAGPVRLGEALAANLQFAAGDGRGGRDLRDMRPGVGRFPERHI